MTEKKAEAPKASKPARMVTFQGIAYPVIRTYYDVRQDLVLDVFEKTKTVPTRGGGFKDITLTCTVLCDNADLQKKYRRGDSQKVEVNVDVE